MVRKRTIALGGFLILAAILALVLVSTPVIGPGGCTDTDGGKNFPVQGTATDSKNSFTDSCINSTTLREYYCQGKVRNVMHTCDTNTTCSNGACQ